MQNRTMMFDKKRAMIKMIMTLFTILILSGCFVPSAKALNGQGGKGFNFLGYRYLDQHKIQIWFDKNLPAVNARKEQLKLHQGVGMTGKELGISDLTPGQGSNHSISGMSPGSTYIVTTDQVSVLMPGQTYTLVLSNTLIANNRISLGAFTFNKPIVFSFTVPQGDGSYAPSVEPQMNFWVEKGSKNLPVEGNIWFSVSLPVANFDEVQNGIKLKENGVPIPFDPVIDAEKTEGARTFAPQSTTDHTFFFLPMVGQGGVASYDLSLKSNYTLEIPAIKTVNNKTIPAQSISFTTAAEDVPAPMSTALLPDPVQEKEGLRLKWNPVIYAQGYNVYFSEDPYWGYVKINTKPIVDNTFLVEGSKTGGNRYFRISAVNSGGEGGLSDLIQIQEASVIPDTKDENVSEGHNTDVNFTDIGSHWARADIAALVGKGIVKGQSNNRFAPDASITRAEFAVMMVKVLGLPAAGERGRFKDVLGTDWYAEAVNTAAANGLIMGSDGQFYPNRLITREEMAVLLIKMYQFKTGQTPASSGLSSFNDVRAISPWALDAVGQAKKAGFISGRRDGSFGPRASATRAEACAMLVRLIG